MHAHLAAGVCALLLAGAALAQDASTGVETAPASQPPVAQAPNPSFRPGFIDALGRWFSESSEKLNSQLKDTRDVLGSIGNQTNEAAKDAAVAAKEAATAIVGLPNARIVTGRERCGVAQNGAPDCRSAAEAICRSKGFASGKSLDTASAQKCPARVWLSGRLPGEGECPVETFVTRVVCQ